MEKLNKKTAHLLIILFIFLSLAAIVLAEVYFSITLNSPENNTVTSDSTPTFNFTVSGTESCYSCRLMMCYPNETFAIFNSSGDLINQTDCSLQCYNSTHTIGCTAGSGCSGVGVACPAGQVCENGTGCFDCSCDGTGYEVHNVSGDIVYVDCNYDKCWSPTAGSTYKWDDAKNYCNNLNHGGFDDWTLPDKDTLHNLCASNSCSGTCFGGEGSTGYYWSSTEYDSPTAYVVRFSDCYVRDYLKGYSHYVRCVRG